MDGFDPKTSFGRDVSLRYDAEDTRGDEEQTVAFLARPAGGREALELAVGTGRIGLRLTRAGCPWTASRCRRTWPIGCARSRVGMRSR